MEFIKENSKTITCCVIIIVVVLLAYYMYKKGSAEYFTVNDIVLTVSPTSNNTLLVTPATTTPAISMFTVNFGDGSTPQSYTAATTHVYSNIGSYAGNIALTYSDGTTGNIPYAVTITPTGITNISITPPPSSTTVSPTTVAVSTTGTIVPTHSPGLYHHGAKNEWRNKGTSSTTSTTTQPKKH